MISIKIRFSIPFLVEKYCILHVLPCIFKIILTHLNSIDEKVLFSRNVPSLNCSVIRLFSCDLICSVLYVSVFV